MFLITTGDHPHWWCRYSADQWERRVRTADTHWICNRNTGHFSWLLRGTGTITTQQREALRFKRIAIARPASSSSRRFQHCLAPALLFTVLTFPPERELRRNDTRAIVCVIKATTRRGARRLRNPPRSQSVSSCPLSRGRKVQTRAARQDDLANPNDPLLRQTGNMCITPNQGARLCNDICTIIRCERRKRGGSPLRYHHIYRYRRWSSSSWPEIYEIYAVFLAIFWRMDKGRDKRGGCCNCETSGWSSGLECEDGDDTYNYI